MLLRKSSFLGSFFGIETSLGLKEIQIRQDSVFFKGLGPQIGYSLN